MLNQIEDLNLNLVLKMIHLKMNKTFLRIIKILEVSFIKMSLINIIQSSLKYSLRVLIIIRDSIKVD